MLFYPPSIPILRYKIYKSFAWARLIFFFHISRFKLDETITLQSVLLSYFTRNIYHQWYYRKKVVEHFNQKSGKTMKIFRGRFNFKEWGRLPFEGEIENFKFQMGGCPIGGRIFYGELIPLCTLTITNICPVNLGKLIWKKWWAKIRENLKVF